MIRKIEILRKSGKTVAIEVGKNYYDQIITRIIENGNRIEAHNNDNGFTSHHKSKCTMIYMPEKFELPKEPECF